MPAMNKGDDSFMSGSSPSASSPSEPDVSPPPQVDEDGVRPVQREATDADMLSLTIQSENRINVTPFSAAYEEVGEAGVQGRGARLLLGAVVRTVEQRALDAEAKCDHLLDQLFESGKEVAVLKERLGSTKANATLRNVCISLGALLLGLANPLDPTDGTTIITAIAGAILLIFGWRYSPSKTEGV